jgi:ferritin-like metal-binding protein YciE
MSEPNERDAKLVQYLNEAYGNEKELETALQADIAMTTKPAYAKRLKQHLKETKSHSKLLERRIKKLGGGPKALQSVLGKATAVAKAPLHMVRGSGEQEKMLKNAKTQYVSEHEEISTYLALENFATKVGDKETAGLVRGIRKEEERMARFLEGQIKQLSAAVSQEIPRALRRTKKASPKKASVKKTGGKKPAAKKAVAKKPAARKAAPKKAAARKAPARKAASKKSAAKKPAAKKTSAKKASKSSAKKASGKKGR